MYTILIVEDDNAVSNMLKDLLIVNGYQAIQTCSGTEALLYINHITVHIILLNLMIPGKTCMEVLNAVKRTHYTPVIALTDHVIPDPTIETLKKSTDDCITKPLDKHEILIRIRAQIQKLEHTVFNPETQELSYKGLIINLETCGATINHTNICLSKKEFEILKLLLENHKKTFTKLDIYEIVWNSEYLGDENTITVHISRIRSKLASVSPNQKYIQTVWGVGFKIS